MHVCLPRPVGVTKRRERQLRRKVQRTLPNGREVKAAQA